jgi:DNA-directed RNA polymerase specialized sigma24 family protein
MAISQTVAQHLPFLRRYARAVAGSQKSGDAYVAATLEALVGCSRKFGIRWWSISRPTP